MNGPSSTRVVYIRCGTRRNRADEIVKDLGAELISIAWPRKPSWLGFLSVINAQLAILRILHSLRPRRVYCEHINPVATLTAWIGSCWLNYEIVADCHNSPFQHKKWKKWAWRKLNSFLFMRCRFVIVHNHQISEFAREEFGTNISFEVLWDRIPDLAANHNNLSKPGLSTHFDVVIISSRNPDEPMDAMMRAASRHQNLSFLLTGPDPFKSKDLLTPKNVFVPGWIDDDEYDRILQSTGIGIALDNRSHVLQHGYVEALAANLPLVANDCETSREYLENGAEFTNSDVPNISDAISRLWKKRDTVRENIDRIRESRSDQQRNQALQILERYAVTP